MVGGAAGSQASPPTRLHPTTTKREGALPCTRCCGRATVHAQVTGSPANQLLGTSLQGHEQNSGPTAS